MLLSACSTQSNPDSVSSEIPSPLPRMTIVNSATLGATATLDDKPSVTPGDFPTVTPHIFCEDTPESQLIIGERGRVTKTDDDETLNLRSGPGIDYRILVQIEQLETFFVLDGIQCSDGYAWFQVNYEGRVGWIAEGDEDQYYAEPYLTG